MLAEEENRTLALVKLVVRELFVLTVAAVPNVTVGATETAEIVVTEIALKVLAQAPETTCVTVDIKEH